MLLWGYVWYNNKKCRKKNQRTFSTASALVCNTNECVTQINVSHLVSTANRSFGALLMRIPQWHTQKTSVLYSFIAILTQIGKAFPTTYFFFCKCIHIKKETERGEGDREFKEANFILDTIRFLIGKK